MAVVQGVHNRDEDPLSFPLLQPSQRLQSMEQTQHVGLHSLEVQRLAPLPPPSHFRG